MNNKTGNNTSGKADRVDAIPAEVKNAVIRYLNIDTINIDTRSVSSEIHDLILIGEKIDWEEVGISGSCEEFGVSRDYPSKTRFTEQLCLEGRQKFFILSLYDWIVSFSDSLQFEMLTLEEKTIADYIRRKFPGREGRGSFSDRINKVMG